MLKTLYNKTFIRLKGEAPQKETATRFYPQLNGLRFLFIFMVLLHHWGPENIFKKIRIGWLGVDLFFVLSGFLIGEILLVEKEKRKNRIIAIKNFIVRRALRIFPLYYITVGIYSALVTTGGILIWNVTYTNNVLQFIDISEVPAVFWHLWSLCVEEQFYLFFPFLVFFVQRKTFLRIVIAGIICSVVGRFLFTYFDYGLLAYALMPFCLDSLFMGVLLGYLKIYYRDKLNRFFSKKLLVYASMLFLPVCLIAISLEEQALVLFSGYRFLGSLLGFCMIGYSVIRSYNGLPKMILENNFISLLGKISYGMYLLHPFVEELYRTHIDDNFLKRFLLNLKLPVVSNIYIIDFVFLFSLTVIVSYLSFRIIEQRFLKMKVLFAG